MENANLTLTQEQFQVAVDHLSQFNSNITTNNTYFLLQIILKCFEKEENPISDLEFRNLTPTLIHQITTFSWKFHIFSREQLLHFQDLKFAVGNLYSLL